MNLPNKLSLLRVMLVPVMVILMLLPGSAAWYSALAVFLLACLTDYLDGQIARSQGLITDLGKFLDPLADKLLLLSSLIMFTALSLCPTYLTIAVLARELAVDGLRMLAASKGQVIAAGKLGKIKTVSQMILVILFFVFRRPVPADPFMTVGAIWVLVITLLSGIDYFKNNLSLFS